MDVATGEAGDPGSILRGESEFFFFFFFTPFTTKKAKKQKYCTEKVRVLW